MKLYPSVVFVFVNWIAALGSAAALPPGPLAQKGALVFSDDLRVWAVALRAK